MLIELLELLSALAFYLCCCLLILGIVVLFLPDTHLTPKTRPAKKTRTIHENAPYYRYTCLVDYVDYALPAGGLKIQPHLIAVSFNNFFSYTMPAARIEDIEIWVHEFVEATIAWILHKMLGHHDFVLSVIKGNVKHKHKVIHLIASLSHVSYMSMVMGCKRLSPNEYEDMFFGRDTNDKEKD